MKNKNSKEAEISEEETDFSGEFKLSKEEEEAQKRRLEELGYL
jgi:hypothetical protein